MAPSYEQGACSRFTPKETETDKRMNLSNGQHLRLEQASVLG
ncbi:MAG: hypothetical protein WBD65_11195 [Methylocella sp.]